jgi:DNA-binding MarR family transcriptional regulator/GNAT superfamily N-acetyltransferase
MTDADAIAAVRRFNRFHTRLIGALGERMLASRFTLAQGRLLYELAQQPQTSAGEIARRLGMDPSYLSRLVAGFEAQGLVERGADAADGRRRTLRLTAAGRETAAGLDAASSEQVAGLLAPLATPDRRALVGSMARIERLLGAPEAGPRVVLRAPEPGDLGWVVHRHGAVYGREYGFDAGFEALVARIVADFADTHDRERERAWIAEVDGEKVGSVFLVGLDAETAKLRLLLVEPAARGLGLGRRLVEACLRFARDRGYRRITLWTQSELTAARAIYAAAGFACVEAVAERTFGRDLVTETWARAL